MEKQSDYFKYKTFSGKFSGAKVLMEQSWKDRPHFKPDLRSTAN